MPGGDPVPKRGRSCLQIWWPPEVGAICFGLAEFPFHICKVGDMDSREVDLR